MFQILKHLPYIDIVDPDPDVHNIFQGFTQFEPLHEISNNVVCATSTASNQPAHMRSLIRSLLVA